MSLRRADGDGGAVGVAVAPPGVRPEHDRDGVSVRVGGDADRVRLRLAPDAVRVPSVGERDSVPVLLRVPLRVVVWDALGDLVAAVILCDALGPREDDDVAVAVGVGGKSM